MFCAPFLCFETRYTLWVAWLIFAFYPILKLSVPSHGATFATGKQCLNDVYANRIK